MDGFSCVSLEPGVWLLASLNSHETNKGMRLKFQDVECFRDYQYEYSDYEDTAAHKEFTVWKPPSLDEIKKEEEKPEVVKETMSVEVDIYTQMFAEELGLRSLKNQSSSSDVEKLDLSFLDYIDVPDGDTNITHNFTESKNQTSIPKPNALNETLFSDWNEVDGPNLRAANLLNQRVSENTRHTQNISTPSTFENSSVYQTENTTVFHSPNILLKNDSITPNSSASVAVSNLNNVSVSYTKNSTVHNATALSMVGNVSTETTNLTVTLGGNSSSVLETETNVTLSGDNQTAVLVEDSEEKLTRGDVFSYSVPPSNSSSNNLHSSLGDNITSLSNGTKKEDENNTATNHTDVSANGTNRSSSVPAADDGEVDSSVVGRNLTMFELEVERTDNKTSDNDSLIATAEPENGLPINSSEIVTIPANSSLENVTHILLEPGPLQNITANISRSNSSGEISSESRENVTALLGELNSTSSSESFSNETMVSGNLTPSNEAIRNYNSEELSASDSSEEVLIYLNENNTEGIKTTSIKTQGHNWTYEGTHQVVPMEIPDYMMKYFGKKTPKTTPTPKKTKKVNLRQWPSKGQGLKTKRKKEYKPQARSGLPFSPRGFHPGMTPRGSRPNVPKPVSDEEELINMPVVIGVPRPDFSDYELYIPGDEPDHLALDEQNVKADEYEYVGYKDPYSSHEDVKNLILDDTTKYYLKFSGSNVKTYFIAAEEVEWDYAGYGQR